MPNLFSTAPTIGVWFHPCLRQVQGDVDFAREMAALGGRVEIDRRRVRFLTLLGIHPTEPVFFVKHSDRTALPVKECVRSQRAPPCGVLNALLSRRCDFFLHCRARLPEAAGLYVLSLTRSLPTATRDLPAGPSPEHLPWPSLSKPCSTAFPAMGRGVAWGKAGIPSASRSMEPRF